MFVLILKQLSSIHIQNTNIDMYIHTRSYMFRQYAISQPDLPVPHTLTEAYLRQYTIVLYNRYDDRLQGGSNMTGTNCDLFTHKSSRSYLNHLVQLNKVSHKKYSSQNICE
jgi:hypothetical protein